ncbi:MAG: T9SS type A sorting domain-containing protein [Bacteroidota bacterium]|nr:T9SS type A sorting domain-containing protein [Bacteroidota bacterium]
MWKAILTPVKVTFPVIAGLLSTCICLGTLYGQLNITAKKDYTRPEVTRQFSPPARIFSFTASKFNGYNEIQWSAISEQNTRKFIAEYSFDGINFQSAGQVFYANGVYNLKHYTFDTRPLLYRVRIEELSGRFYYSDNILLDGIDVQPVKIYPTIVTGSVVNVNAGLPVERITITSADGRQLFAKDLNGIEDFIPVIIPSLNKGMYWMTFYGYSWKSTTEFIVQ